MKWNINLTIGDDQNKETLFFPEVENYELTPDKFYVYTGTDPLWFCWEEIIEFEIRKCR